MYRLKLANVMGMDINNAQNGVGITDALNDITKPDEFIEYCRSNREGIEYANRVEKLDILATRYKREINNIKTGVLENFCQTTTHKFKAAISVLRDNEVYLSKDLSKLNADGHRYFTEKELELLNSVGGLNRLIALYELGTLYEALYHRIVKLAILKNNNARLSNGQKKIQNKIKGIR